jgi:hypothetical protein
VSIRDNDQARLNRGMRNVGGEYQESSLFKMRRNNVIANHRT